MFPWWYATAKVALSGNLRREDFQLFDKGKPQVISQFSVEKGGIRGGAQEIPSEDAVPKKPTGPVIPERYVAYLFDDVHLAFADLARARTAAIHYFMTSLQATDPVAVFTTSGQNTLDFTVDRTDLMSTLNNLRPRPIASGAGTECPDVSYYQADLIQNKNDQQALQAATLEAQACNPLPSSPQASGTAQQQSSAGQSQQAVYQSIAQAAASRAIASGRSGDTPGSRGSRNCHPQSLDYARSTNHCPYFSRLPGNGGNPDGDRDYGPGGALECDHQLH